MKQYKIKVICKSAINKIFLSDNPKYDFKVKVNSIPEKGKANKKVLELLAEHFAISQNSIMIISGEHNNLKTIQINE